MIKKIEMIPASFEILGYKYDSLNQGWFTPQAPSMRKFFFPPFGFSKKMLTEGLQFWVDEDNHIIKFKFGN